MIAVRHFLGLEAELPHHHSIVRLVGVMQPSEARAEQWI